MGFLILENEEVFPGRFLGGRPQGGEVVFNTAHQGYEEMATDPSYFSQIVVMTAPMQGNYGESHQVWQSDHIWIRGFVCLKMQSSHLESSWKQKLSNYGIPILDQVDTRSLTLSLRNHGSIYGAISNLSSLDEAKKQTQKLIQKSRDQSQDWPYLISSTKIQDKQGQNPKGPRVAVIDFGCKKSIIENLLLRCSYVRIFPPRVSLEEIIDFKPGGLLLSNGPGDPLHVQKSVETIRSCIGKYFIFGICMGCQLLARALGGETKKLKFGHRGINHPVKDSLFDRVYMTSQNHGYVVIRGSLPEDIQITHTNLNDQTIQGFFSKKKKLMAVQFHPENRPGPEDSTFLFDKFIEFIKENPNPSLNL